MENPKERIEDILKRNPYLDAKLAGNQAAMLLFIQTSQGAANYSCG